MKLIRTFAAASLLLSSAAFAANAPAAAPMAAPAAPMAAPMAAPAAPAAMAPAKQDHHCRDGANEKHLKGASRASFIKKCRADAMSK